MQLATFSYDEQMCNVLDKGKTACHQKAMAASEKEDLFSLIELWLWNKEYDRLVS